MSIGNTLFSRIATDQFARQQSAINDLQDRIASGINDPRPSADPVKALRLASSMGQQANLDRYMSVARAAGTRLAETDAAVSDISTMTQRLREIALQASTITVGGQQAVDLKNEVVALRDNLMDVGNARDSQGQPLFSGYGSQDAFVETAGKVSYAGDSGRTTARISERLIVATSVNGHDLFAAGPGGSDLFALVDDLISVLDGPLQGGEASVTARDRAMLSLEVGREVGDFEFTLTGPTGSAQISAKAVAGAPNEMIDAINAQLAQTGVSAGFSADGKDIVLLATGNITLSEGNRSDDARRPVLKLQQLGSAMQPSGDFVALRPTRLTASALVESFADATFHMADQRAEVGALSAAIDRQVDVIAARQAHIDGLVASMTELDMAETVTRLQGLLLAQQASQQTFVKIQMTGLFDYLR